MSKKKVETSRDSDLGNTKAKSVQGIQSKRWTFTWNNYDKNCEEILEMRLRSFGEFIAGYEIGIQGTKHLQGFVVCPKRHRWSEFKLPAGIHWENMEGSVEQNVKYCTKDGDYFGTYYIQEIPKMYGWQLKVLEIMDEPIDPRIIHWFWEPTGGVGKTDCCRYLVMKHDVIIVGGKAADMKYLIAKRNKKTFNVIVNITKEEYNYVSYTGLEQVKDGLFCSSKYESEMYCGPKPRMIVFCNAPPMEEKMGKGRFKVVDIRTLDPYLVVENSELE